MKTRRTLKGALVAPLCLLLAGAVAATLGSGVAMAGSVDCNAQVGTTKIATHFDDGTMKGTVTIDGTETRRFNIRATPYAATAILMFDSYGTGDQKPAAEKLTAKSYVVRVVANGDHSELYFDGDVHPGGVPGSAVRCGK